MRQGAQQGAPPQGDGLFRGLDRGFARAIGELARARLRLVGQLLEQTAGKSDHLGASIAGLFEIAKPDLARISMPR